MKPDVMIIKLTYLLWKWIFILFPIVIGSIIAANMSTIYLERTVFAISFIIQIFWIVTYIAFFDKIKKIKYEMRDNNGLSKLW